MPIAVYGEGNPDHRRFIVERNASLWRYLDIAKYIDIITKDRIWFQRVSELRKVDPYESTPTKYDEEKRTRVVEAKTKDELRSIVAQYILSDFVPFIDNNPDKSLKFFQLLLVTQNITDMNAYTHSISCWHENQGESDAMWALYAGRNAGIAIKSSVSRVLEAFKSSSRQMSIAKVTYDSPSGTLSAETSGIYDSLLIKRHAYHHESEVRIIAKTLDGYESSDPTRYYIDFAKPVPPGVYIECDIYSLIEEVVVSPLMPLYAFQAIEDMTSRVLSRRIPIRRSTLLAKEDAPTPMSRELAAMLEQYRRTGLSGLR
jgi:hypothetical protein